MGGRSKIYPGWWFHIFFMFTPKIGVSWSNLTIAYFSNLLVQPPTSTLLRINITSHQKSQLWVDDFPNFPFGGICDRSLEGIYIYLWVFLWMCPIRRVGDPFLAALHQANVQAKAMPRPVPKACKELLKGVSPANFPFFFRSFGGHINECPDIFIKYCKCENIYINIIYIISTLPETNIAPEKLMVGILVSLWDGLFAGAMLPVSFRECIYYIYTALYFRWMLHVMCKSCWFCSKTAGKDRGKEDADRSCPLAVSAYGFRVEAVELG